MRNPLAPFGLIDPLVRLEKVALAFCTQGIEGGRELMVDEGVLGQRANITLRSDHCAMVVILEHAYAIVF